jgi:thiamine transporter 2/3
VGNFIQPLWETLHPRAHEGDLYNGAVEAASTLAGAILAFAFAYVKLNWALVGEPLLVVISVVDGIVLIAMGWADNIWLAYVGYLLYRSLFQMLITVARHAKLCEIDHTQKSEIIFIAALRWHGKSRQIVMAWCLE